MVSHPPLENMASATPRTPAVHSPTARAFQQQPNQWTLPHHRDPREQYNPPTIRSPQPTNGPQQSSYWNRGPPARDEVAHVPSGYLYKRRRLDDRDMYSPEPYAQSPQVNHHQFPPGYERHHSPEMASHQYRARGRRPSFGRQPEGMQPALSQQQPQRHPPMHMAPPPHPQQRMRASIPHHDLVLPPLRTNAEAVSSPPQFRPPGLPNVESVLKALPTLGKIKLLAKIAPPMKRRPSNMQQGSVIAIEARDPAVVELILDYLKQALMKEGLYAVSVFRGPDDVANFRRSSYDSRASTLSERSSSSSSNSLSDATTSYLETLTRWHEISKQVEQFVTEGHFQGKQRTSSDTMDVDSPDTKKPRLEVTPPSRHLRTTRAHAADSPPTNSDKAYSHNPHNHHRAADPSPPVSPHTPTQTLSKTHISSTHASPASPLIPVALLPSYQLTTSDTAALHIPLQDAYAPIDNWQWAATLWRGCVGPDLTICVVDEKANASIADSQSGMLKVGPKTSVGVGSGNTPNSGPPGSARGAPPPSHAPPHAPPSAAPASTTAQNLNAHARNGDAVAVDGQAVLVKRFVGGSPSETAGLSAGTKEEHGTRTGCARGEEDKMLRRVAFEVSEYLKEVDLGVRRE